MSIPPLSLSVFLARKKRGRICFKLEFSRIRIWFGFAAPAGPGSDQSKHRWNNQSGQFFLRAPAT